MLNFESSLPLLDYVECVIMQVSVHCMDILAKELQANAALLSHDSSHDPVEAAVDVEYFIFSEVKSSLSYKLHVNKYVSIIAYLMKRLVYYFFFLFR